MAKPPWQRDGKDTAKIVVQAAYQVKPVEETKNQSEVKGVFQAVYGNTIKVFTVGKESKEFTVADNVYVTLAGIKAGLGDLKAGNVVKLQLNSDKVVVAINATT